MVKVDIISGFLGAGKTTLIKKLLEGPLQDKKVVVVENEYGEIGIDGRLLSETGVVIKEITSGCICCSLTGDFIKALQEIVTTYDVDRIIIEPSGVGALSEVIHAVEKASEDLLTFGCVATVVDVTKYIMYKEAFGDFFIDQAESAKTIILSRTDLPTVTEKLINEVSSDLRMLNPHAAIITDPLNTMVPEQLLYLLEEGDLPEEECPHGDHDHEHHEHHEHEADGVFSTVGIEIKAHYTAEEIRQLLEELSDTGRFGYVLRAKGIIFSENGSGLAFDMVPGETEVKEAETPKEGGISVIGTGLQIEKIRKHFVKSTET